MDPTRTVQWCDDAVVLIDQTALPDVERFVTCATVQRVADAISTLEVRGAPAIGVTGAMGVALAGVCSTAAAPAEVLAELETAAELLVATRPTAVNLRWGCEQVVRAAGEVADAGGDRDAVVAEAVRMACWLAEDDVARCRAIGQAGSQLFDGCSDVVTHCNAGALATVAYGTALGVVRAARDRNPDLHVWVDETRPVLQGARLTSYELGRDGITNTVIADGVAASLMRAGRIGAAVVGADRIAANGDVANKIGTYSLAVAAHHHGVPFYVAAPLSTVDALTAAGADIVIEERDPDEVRNYRGQPVTPAGAAVHNPAFDVTPAELVTGIVTEVGVLHAPYGPALAAALSGAR
ncbi:MAG: S-methyl-5-thioribose-1-phosphate isomerase [Acidimicrobiia bacterium]|nr:S-methyl-5-thioribose-1-phosphate isomerase [Acidimicrobiia bacterium]